MKAHQASHWDDTLSILQTELRGAVTAADVELWKRELYAELDRIPDGRPFRLLLDLNGFEPLDGDAYKSMRGVVPHILLSHGMRPAHADLFDEADELSLTMLRNRRCFAFANVQQDAGEMDQHEIKIGRGDQQFFTESEKAWQWLIQQPVPLSGI